MRVMYQKTEISGVCKRHCWIAGIFTGGGGGKADLNGGKETGDHPDNLHDFTVNEKGDPMRPAA